MSDDGLEERRERYVRMAALREEVNPATGKVFTLAEIGEREGLTRERVRRILHDGPPSGSLGGRPRKQPA